MRVLVTGATGYIGGRLVAVLQNQGHELRVLVRHRVDGHWDGIEQVAGNLAHPASLQDVCQGVDSVCHLGGGMRPSDGDVTTVNVIGSRALLDDAMRHHVRRFVFVSAAVVYGNVKSPPASEESIGQPLPGHAYAIAKWRAEQQLLTSVHGNIELVIVRIPQVYSAGSLSIRRFPHLAAQVHGRNLTHFVHREDVVQALAMLIQSAYPSGTYNVADNFPLTVRDAAALIQQAMGEDETGPAMNPIPAMLRRVMEATLVLDTRKIAALGIIPMYSTLEMGLRNEI